MVTMLVINVMPVAGYRTIDYVPMRIVTAIDYITDAWLPCYWVTLYQYVAALLILLYQCAGCHTDYVNQLYCGYVIPMHGYLL
jgi:hypothetical protein